LSGYHDDEQKPNYHLTGAAAALLVMGVSLAVIIVLYVSFGHIGSSFSNGVLQRQQASLRSQFGLPPEPTVNPQEATIPPSLRNISGNANTISNATTVNQSSAPSSSATVSNATSPSTGNSSTVQGSTAGQTTSISIVSNGVTLGDKAFSPNPVSVKVGSTVTWTNNDALAHTVTSGAGQNDPNKGGEFDSSPNYNPLLLSGKSFSHTFKNTGDFPYFCQLHPQMVGKITVS